MPDWTLEEVSPNVHTIRFPDTGLSETRQGWEQWVLLMADEHWDNPHCDRELLKRHHDEALERGAAIIKIGDTFCAMQGRWDPRANKSDLREEHQEGDYLDRLVSTAADWYEPYASNIALICPGNHEISIRKKHESDLVTRLVERLRDRGGITRVGGFAGWVRFMFQKSPKANRRSFKLHYHHGWGGGGPVTKGAIQYNRIAEYIESDFLVMGHVHWKGYTPVTRAGLDNVNKVVTKTIHYLRCGSYKDDYQAGAAGWHVERGQGPRPLGGWWLHFTCDTTDQVQVEVREAT